MLVMLHHACFSLTLSTILPTAGKYLNNGSIVGYYVTIRLCYRGADDHDSSSSGGSIGNRVLSTFLNELDGISSLPSSSSHEAAYTIFVVAACTSLDHLDEALLRPG